MIYRHLSVEDMAHLSPSEAAKYAAERRAFDREVEQHKAHIREHGWLDLGAGGRIAVPVVLVQGGRR